MKPNFIIFTDGSIRRIIDHDQQEEITAGSYGVVVLDTATMRYVEFGGRLKTASAIYAEAWAIYRGLQYVNGLCMRKNRKPKVLLVTDSKINTEVLTKYIRNSWDISDWKNWKKRDGTPVKNQELYRDIITLIGSNGIETKIVHINSHMTRDRIPELQTKLKSYGIATDVRTAELILDMNSRADAVASEITRDEIKRIKSRYGSRKKLIWEPVRKIVG